MDIDSAVTWEALLVILAVVALIVVIAYFARRV
jgi:hypothetical protein